MILFTIQRWLLLIDYVRIVVDHKVVDYVKTVVDLLD
jgi:hypothetical protein